MKKFAMIVAGVALALSMSGCAWTKCFVSSTCDLVPNFNKKGCGRYVKPYCPACDRFVVHEGICPAIYLYED